MTAARGWKHAWMSTREYGEGGREHTRDGSTTSSIDTITVLISFGLSWFSMRRYTGWMSRREVEHESVTT